MLAMSDFTKKSSGMNTWDLHFVLLTAPSPFPIPLGVSSVITNNYESLELGEHFAYTVIDSTDTRGSCKAVGG